MPPWFRPDAVATGLVLLASYSLSAVVTGLVLLALLVPRCSGRRTRVTCISQNAPFLLTLLLCIHYSGLGSPLRYGFPRSTRQRLEKSQASVSLSPRADRDGSRRRPGGVLARGGLRALAHSGVRMSSSKYAPSAAD